MLNDHAKNAYVYYHSAQSLNNSRTYYYIMVSGVFEYRIPKAWFLKLGDIKTVADIRNCFSAELRGLKISKLI